MNSGINKLTVFSGKADMVGRGYGHGQFQNTLTFAQHLFFIYT